MPAAAQLRRLHPQLAVGTLSPERNGSRLIVHDQRERLIRGGSDFVPRLKLNRVAAFRAGRWRTGKPSAAESYPGRKGPALEYFWCWRAGGGQCEGARDPDMERGLDC